MSTMRVTFFIFYFLHAANDTTSTNSLQLHKRLFSGQALIVMGENWLMKEVVYLYDKKHISSPKCTECIDFGKLYYIKVT